MTAKQASPLKAAMAGDTGKLTDKQKESALSEAVGRLSKVTRLAESSKEQVVATGTALMHSAETMGALFMSSMAEGFLGQDKLQLGGVDLRAPTGLLMQGYGLYQILSGEGGGEHFLSLGNGVTGSWLASVGTDAGKALRDRRNGASAPGPGSVPPAPGQPTTFRGDESYIYIPPLEQPMAPFGGPDALATQNGYGPNPQGYPARAPWPPASPTQYQAAPMGYGQPYPQSGYPQTPYPPPNYGQSGYAQPDYPQANYPQANYLQTNYPALPPGQYPQQPPRTVAPQLAGPVREILPEDISYAQAPARAASSDRDFNDYPRGSAQTHQPVMRFTPPDSPEAEPRTPSQKQPSPGMPTTTMRFTPDAPASPPRAHEEARTNAEAASTRPPPFDDVSGPRQHMQERRQARHQAFTDRFPRARRAQEAELEAE